MAEAEQAEIERLRADNQRLRAEARDSAAANAKFRVLFEHSSDAHLIFDDTGIIDCNRAAVEMLRCADKSQVLRLHPAVLSPELQPDGRRSLEKNLEMDGLARTRGHHRFEWVHRRMTGEDFLVEVTLTAFSGSVNVTRMSVCLGTASAPATGADVATAGAAATRFTVVRVTAICSVGAGVDEQAASAPSASAAVAVRISADECMVYGTPLEVVGDAAPVCFLVPSVAFCFRVEAYDPLPVTSPGP